MSIYQMGVEILRTINSIEDALGAAGQDLGTSSWWSVDQGGIDQFADVTGDHQWIHVDVERATAEGPYGATIAHGFLTLSLLPAMSKEIYLVANARHGLNYGLDKVRFLAPVPAGSRIRLRSALVAVKRVAADTVNLTVRHTLEIAGFEKPALVADLITRWVF